MCYFQVIFNIRKRYATKLGTEQWHELYNYIKPLHYSRSEKERDMNWQLFADRYKQAGKPKEEDLYEYIRVQWYDSRFNNWMIYHTPAGLANTNSNIESFNATIKRNFFFNRKRLSVYGATLKLKELIKYYSKTNIPFHTIPRYEEKLHKKANLKLVSDFIPIGSKHFKILSRYGDHKISIVNKSSTCPIWLKKAICVHTLACSNLKGMNWYGNWRKISAK